jgi:methyl-accepting chemotaxis protein
VIICAKLGEDGRALRELAHWLRDLTDASDAIIAHLQGILAQARDSLHQLTEARIGRLEQLLQIFAQASENLDQLLQGAAADVGKTAKEFAHSAVVLPQHLSNATDLLDGLQAQIAQRRPAQAQLEQGLALMPQPLPETLGAAPLGPVLQQLYALYTMQAERKIHSQVIDGYTQPVPDAPQPTRPVVPQAVPAPPPEPTGENDDLEDIFF